MLSQNLLEILVIHKDFILHCVEVFIVSTQKIEVPENIIHYGNPSPTSQHVPIARSASEQPSYGRYYPQKHCISPYSGPIHFSFDLLFEFIRKLIWILVKYFFKLLDMIVIERRVYF